MDGTTDELAGVVDLFGGLTRTELERALSEVAFRADGQSVDGDAAEEAIAAALDSFALVSYDRRDATTAHVAGEGERSEATPADDGVAQADDSAPAPADTGTTPAGDDVRVDDGDGPLLVAGPTAFPSVPTHAEDLPHILDVERRRVDRDALAQAGRAQFARAVDEAIDAGEADRLRGLVDVSYDFEAWASMDLATERSRLDEALE